MYLEITDRSRNRGKARTDCSHLSAACWASSSGPLKFKRTAEFSLKTRNNCARGADCSHQSILGLASCAAQFKEGCRRILPSQDLASPVAGEAKAVTGWGSPFLKNPPQFFFSNLLDLKKFRILDLKNSGFTTNTSSVIKDFTISFHRSN